LTKMNTTRPSSKGRKLKVTS